MYPVGRLQNEVMGDPAKPVKKEKSKELVPTGRRPLTAADVPPEVEWYIRF